MEAVAEEAARQNTPPNTLGCPPVLDIVMWTGAERREAA